MDQEDTVEYGQCRQQLGTLGRGHERPRTALAGADAGIVLNPDDEGRPRGPRAREEAHMADVQQIEHTRAEDGPRGVGRPGEPLEIQRVGGVHPRARTYHRATDPKERSMRASTHHHIGVRVTDIERAAQFYIDAFDGHWMARPFTLSGDFAEVVMEGPPGVSFRVCMVGLDEGCMELFEFVEPVHPIEPVHPTRGNIIHFGIQVDDVGEALRRVEAAGGTRIWPDISPVGHS